MFGVLERAEKYQRSDDSLTSDIDHVLRPFRAYEIATTSSAIGYSWTRTGLGCQATDSITYLVVEDDQIRAVDAFLEIWKFDFHPNQLSQRRALGSGNGPTNISYGRRGK
jgi:hypothetical protein